MKNYPILGSHVSLNAKDDYLIGALKTTLKNDANTMMIFTGPPQTTKRTPTKNFKIQEFHQLLATNKIDVKDLVVHAPYLINLANPINPGIWKFSVDFLAQEMSRCAEIGIKTLVLHPGSYLQGDVFAALDKIVEGLDLVFAQEPKTRIALETMSGKGTEVGINFEQFHYIFNRVKNQQRVGVCLDTCHLNDAGYDLKHWEEVKTTIQKIIGWKKVWVIHLNDSKNTLASHKDRHENIGYGTIGFDILNQIVWDEDFKEIPKILETPYFENRSPYQQEIADLRQKRFTHLLKTKK